MEFTIEAPLAQIKGLYIKLIDDLKDGVNKYKYDGLNVRITRIGSGLKDLGYKFPMARIEGSFLVTEKALLEALDNAEVVSE